MLEHGRVKPAAKWYCKYLHSHNAGKKLLAEASVVTGAGSFKACPVM
jgi:hypothetical protein